ncbi:ArsC family reductase [Qipengyuania huizhouensis]|jgi:Spx/MgsR family transcriptional regulator|uniref:ArsC family reductase n=1 Tax=Qipengyuania huizhouensis TaxID=2867245 RepID=UPI0017D0D7C1|nr:ArsC family reductase [Qipengyuania huizhouensis]MBA4765426.1 ArsC family reductase [Erythrobacter sp.]MBX7461828.1 ArsC family reductase [Qipengyuania huizhouensis]
MTKLAMYGIPNCDTVKKARKWLEAEGIEYAFHDYKKEGADPARLSAWSDAAGWEALLNRRGTTFRKLPDEDKADIDRVKAIDLMVKHPSMIKRPVIEHDGGILVGFSEDGWSAALQ